MASAYQVVNQAWNDGLRPPPLLSVSDWADRYRFVAAPSPEPGEWHTERTPYLRQIMDCLSPMEPARTVAVMKGSQMGVTEAALNWLGYKIHQYPSSFLIVLPTQGVAEEWSKTRLTGMIEHSPVMRDLIQPQKSRDSGNTIFNKKVAGGRGLIKFAWSSSAAKQRSTPAGDLILDEVDGFDGDAEGEGDPVTSLKRRFTNFPRGKMFMVSTPTGASGSRINREFLAGDQRHYFMPCPSCGHYQRFVFRNLEIPKAAGEEAIAERDSRYRNVGLRCIACHDLIAERHKGKMLADGIWVATAGHPELADGGFGPDDMPSLTPIFNEMKVARWLSFHLPAGCSPLGWYSWSTMAADWEAVQVKKDVSALKVFVMQVLGEVWEDERGEAPDDEMLWRRRESYEIGVVPKRGLFLTAAVDVQDESLHVEVKAWGRNKENWSVFYQVIQCETKDGHPIKTSSPEPWEELETILARDWPHESGQTMAIIAMGIDTGFRPQMVYDFALRHARPVHNDATGSHIAAVRTVVPIKGTDDHLRLISGVSKTDAARKRQGVRIWSVGTAWAKQEFYDSLRRPLPDNPEVGGYPAGYCHYPYHEREFYKQVCSESRVVRSGGKVEWVRDPARRNEPVDTHVYNRAMAELFGISRFQEGHWVTLEQKVAVVAATPLVAPTVAAPQPDDRERWIPRRKNWLSQ